MFGEHMNHMNLEREFKNLGKGINQSLKSSLNISLMFGSKFFRALRKGFWELIEPPKLHRKMGPDSWEEVERGRESHHHHHPPNLR